MKKSTIKAIIILLTLYLTGCSSQVNIIDTDEKHYDIQYFTDRTDQFYEYASPTNVAFVVTTDQGRYHFSDSEMSLGKVYEYMEAFEAGVGYANDWFGQDDIMLDLYFIQRDFTAEYGSNEFTINGSGVDGVVWVEYDYSFEPLPFHASHILMHESIHALCDVYAEKTNFPRRPEPYPFFWSMLLEEGLATMLEHSYGLSVGKLHDVYIYHYTQDGSDSSEGALDKVNDIAEALDHLALYSIYSNGEEFYAELPYDILQSYNTSASFLYWLLVHNGSKEDFRRVYVDINLMEEVYGKDMNVMIENWLEYLGQPSIIYTNKES